MLTEEEVTRVLTDSKAKAGLTIDPVATTVKAGAKGLDVRVLEPDSWGEQTGSDPAPDPDVTEDDLAVLASKIGRSACRE
jgi:hypothetical protein